MKKCLILTKILLVIFEIIVHLIFDAIQANIFITNKIPPINNIPLISLLTTYTSIACCNKYGFTTLHSITNIISNITIIDLALYGFK